MAEEVARLAKEIADMLRPELKETTAQCVGEECKRIRREYEDIEKKAETEDVEARRWGELLKAIDDRLGTMEERIEGTFEPGEPGDKSISSEEDCPNCGYDKKRKPKFIGHCSKEGNDVKFSDYEKELDWENCPNCGESIDWED